MKKMDDEYMKQMLINQNAILGALSLIVYKMKSPYSAGILEIIQIALSNTNKLLGVEDFGDDFGL